ncbi:MAG: hypothetical protein IPO15_15650 [Anaerolineae bacterium]|uniref:hypothetical protein n=1 Tax=Candidatus Amarolinea dominans TaxID=3140696 RepID=UPI003134F143|nr:hypothetical protein [Anaerolineae bacterium]
MWLAAQVDLQGYFVAGLGRRGDTRWLGRRRGRLNRGAAVGSTTTVGTIWATGGVGAGQAVSARLTAISTTKGMAHFL